MNFDYSTLKMAARDGTRMGSWRGKAVFAASYNDLVNRGNGAYYILYDDENTIVAKTNQGWMSFGKVSEYGQVHEYSNARNYRSPAVGVRQTSTSGMRYSSEPIPQAVVKVSHATEASYTPGYDGAERPVGDVKTEIDVERVLKMAREMTIESLLEGFLPEVSYEVVRG